MSFIASFEPEVWIDDEAVPADPWGDTDWDCTAFVESKGMTEAVSKGIEAEGRFIDRDDILVDDPAAPKWIKRWAKDHPFTITICPV